MKRPELRRGMYFFHAHWIDTIYPPGASVPAICKVTRVARGTVYYRIAYIDNGRETFGGSYCFPAYQAPVYVRGYPQ